MSKKFYGSIIVIFLLIFCSMRPILSTAFFNIPIATGVSYAIVFAIGFSYAMVIAVMLNGFFRKFGLTELSILLFLLYASFSVIWGSNIKEVSRLILPFVMFFAVRLAASEIDLLKKFIKIILIAFLIPTIGSSLLIVTGLSQSMTSYWTGITRYSGFYGGPHSLAHEMFICLTIIILYVYTYKHTNDRKRLPTYLIYTALIFCGFNIYISFTRTVYIGLTIFIFINLFGRKQYLLLASSMFLIIVLAFISDKLSLIFYDITGPLTGDDITGAGYRGMGSGRFGLWGDALAQFTSLPFERFFLGTGLGKESIYSMEYFGASHSDLIGLLLGLGIIGVVLYFVVIGSFVFDILNSNFDRPFKYFFLGFIFAVLVMNFGSNSYLSRFQLSQYFFFIVGIFYVLRDFYRHGFIQKAES